MATWEIREQEDGSLPFVPVTTEEKWSAASIDLADGRTIDRMLEPGLTAYKGA